MQQCREVFAGLAMVIGINPAEHPRWAGNRAESCEGWSDPVQRGIGGSQILITLPWLRQTFLRELWEAVCACQGMEQGLPKVTPCLECPPQHTPACRGSFPLASPRPGGQESFLWQGCLSSWPLVNPLCLCFTQRGSRANWVLIDKWKPAGD